MAKSMNAQTCLSLDQQIMDFAVHSTLWPWKHSCKISYNMKILFFSILYSFFNYLSKNGSRWVGGIENAYHEPCQDWIDLVNMKLTSPNYPEPYEQLEHCTWNITAPQGHYVSLDFELINVSDKDKDLNA